MVLKARTVVNWLKILHCYCVVKLCLLILTDSVFLLSYYVKDHCSFKKSISIGFKDFEKQTEEYFGLILSLNPTYRQAPSVEYDEVTLIMYDAVLV